MSKLLKLEQVQKTLNDLVKDYLEDVSENINEDGIIDWGGGKLGYEGEIQLVEDLLLYAKYSI